MASVVEVRELRKSYGDTVAVQDVSLTVQRGEIFGIIGPNGAGKTTTVECIEGLLRQRMGVQLQDSQLPEQVRVGERFGCLVPSTGRHRTPS
jgi:ABC-2 type transport system ATP-binding protein